jgi:tRNA dimethylallyltransferase
MSGSNSSLPPLVVIAGPTAVGKTSLAIALAGRFQGEIVNADSRSFYRGMDIGTAKPDSTDRETIPHHLIDILEPSDDMSLSYFQELAFEVIGDIHARKRLPLLVGGTAQYLNAVVENWKIPQVAPDNAFRSRMEQRVAVEGVAPLIEELRAVDSDSADRTGPNPRRVIRALEIFHVTGQPMSRLMGKGTPRYDTLQFELWVPRDILHDRIARRVEDMFAHGLVEEVQSLLRAGIDPSFPAFSSIGYREVVALLNGEMSLNETKAAIRHASNRLVRHQQTWFRKNPAMNRVDMTDSGAIAEIIEKITEMFPRYPSLSCE